MCSRNSLEAQRKDISLVAASIKSCSNVCTFLLLPKFESHNFKHVYMECSFNICILQYVGQKYNESSRTRTCGVSGA